MEVIDRPAVPGRTLRMEAVDFPPIKAAVIVRALKATERMVFRNKPGSFEEHVPELLSRCVMAKDYRPLYSAEEWETFDPMEFTPLLEAIKRLSNPTEDQEKN